MLKSGITGGVLTVFLANIHSADIIKTVVLSAMGAVISAIVSLLVKKWLTKDK